MNAKTNEAFAFIRVDSRLENPAAPDPQRRRKKEEEPETQTLELPKEPPATVVAESDRLSFHVSPLSAKGLLSQQTRDALRSLSRQVRGASIVKLRAFVAGAGDTRRVATIVSETFTDRRQPLPALTVVQVGGLPLEGAQIVLEAIAAEKKAVNPHGLAFISGQLAADDRPLQPPLPLLEKSVAGLRSAAAAVKAEPKDVLRVTCFTTSLDDYFKARARLAELFPAAAMNFVQPQRAPTRTIVECEAVARPGSAPQGPLGFLNPPELTKSAMYSQVALVAPARLVLSGTQMAFGYTEDDARLAFQRLGKALEQAGASFGQVAVSHVYPLSNSIAELSRKVRQEFYSRESPPASTMLIFEGLPSLDAAFGVDVIAIRQ